MKKFKKEFRDIGNYHFGRMFIRQHYLAGDKQDHILKGMFVSISYFIMHFGFEIADLKAMFISFSLVIVLAYLWEYFRKTGINHYDVLADVIGWVLLVIVGGQLMPLI